MAIMRGLVVFLAPLALWVYVQTKESVGVCLSLWRVWGNCLIQLGAGKRMGLRNKEIWTSPPRYVLSIFPYTRRCLRVGAWSEVPCMHVSIEKGGGSRRKGDEI